ncbi:hypothetical protein [Okeania sp.]|uniref:hypothetical protein n=1 Tax=Okeania sp. TaxID=3100323 RepID=UPI002B4B14F1|nr:hypothetical protein [Okeania sp.]MEB3339907.1 hypothetical protein [Okeania sp.]
MVTLNSKNLSKFTFNGGAGKINQTLVFNTNGQQVGSAFYFKPIKLDKDTSFETSFSYISGIDVGLTFLLHNDPRKDNTLSTDSFDSGEGITSSIGIELDGFVDNEVNFNINGNFTPAVSIPANVQLSNADGSINVWIEYNGKNDRLKVFTASTTTKPRTPILSTKVDIVDTIGNKAYVGFGGWSFWDNNLGVNGWNFSTSDTSSGTGKNINGNNKNNRLEGTNKNETIDGKNGNDILIGAAGNDTLVGGGGADDFVLGSGKAYKKNDLGIDTITDFQPNVDDIILDTDTFVTLKSDLGEGFSIQREFASVKNKKAVAGSIADIVYDRSTGDLYYNANGALSGFGGGGKIATLEGAPKISASDFILE